MRRVNQQPSDRRESGEVSALLSGGAGVKGVGCPWRALNGGGWGNGKQGRRWGFFSLIKGNALQTVEAWRVESGANQERQERDTGAFAGMR